MTAVAMHCPVCGDIWKAVQPFQSWPLCWWYLNDLHRRDQRPAVFAAEVGVIDHD